MSKRITILILATLLLAACGGVPQRKTETAPAATGAGGYLEGDGPGADAPANLDAIPDAVPKNEPLHRYANRPYVALGKTYTPLTVTGSYKERGIASWYGKKFHGRRTSSGETYDMYAMTAAHPTMPLPSYARVTNPANQKSVIVRVNDRGPFLHDRVIDLSYTAAHKLGIIGNGSAEVEVESLSPDAVLNTIAPNSVQNQPMESSMPAAAASTVAAPAASLTSLENSNTNVYLQLGAFESQQNAEIFLAQMRNELGSTGKQLKLSSKDGLVRVHIGPYASQSEARSSAESMEGKLGFKPMLYLP
ncbi:MAG: septal ring lytic transglycosylase RlpA family protein [Gallionella sp.]|nr:septal ring lytic transglycosylase RlpA family protein [Gallionella sp.]